MDLQLTGRRVLVTGGSRGIGKAAAGRAVPALQVDTGDDASGSVIGSIRNVAVSAMTKNLADELGPSGVNVNAVHPGLTRTEATPGVIAAQAAARAVIPIPFGEKIFGPNGPGACPGTPAGPHLGQGSSGIAWETWRS